MSWQGSRQTAKRCSAVIRSVSASNSLLAASASSDFTLRCERQTTTLSRPRPDRGHVGRSGRAGKQDDSGGAVRFDSVVAAGAGFEPIGWRSSCSRRLPSPARTPPRSGPASPAARARGVHDHDLVDGPPVRPRQTRHVAEAGRSRHSARTLPRLVPAVLPKICRLAVRSAAASRQTNATHPDWSSPPNLSLSTSFPVNITGYPISQRGRTRRLRNAISLRHSADSITDENTSYFQSVVSINLTLFSRIRCAVTVKTMKTMTWEAGMELAYVKEGRAARSRFG